VKADCLAVAVLFLGVNVRAQPANAISSSWDKRAPVTTALSPQCGPNGSGGDSATNHPKNRSDEPGTYHEVVVAAGAGYRLW